MPYVLYVRLQDENTIVAFTMEATTGQTRRTQRYRSRGGPSVLALSPDRHVLYVGHRGQPAIASFQIDPPWWAHAPGDGRSDPRTHVSGPRPHR
jgi:6-phosphogluconolactonase (cycloisomerase 2 family)